MNKNDTAGEIARSSSESALTFLTSLLSRRTLSIFLYLGLLSQYGNYCSQLIILVESPKDDNVYQYIRASLGRVLSIIPFNLPWNSSKVFYKS